MNSRVVKYEPTEVRRNRVDPYVMLAPPQSLISNCQQPTLIAIRSFKNGPIDTVVE